jgi:hypothetical protein
MNCSLNCPEVRVVPQDSAHLSEKLNFKYCLKIQILQKEGFVPARPIEGTILVNIGDLLQRWTNDKLVSTVSRPFVDIIC